VDGPKIALLVLLAVLAVPGVGAQTESVAWAEDLELANDAFLPTSEAATTGIVDGDLAWAALSTEALDPDSFDVDDPPREALEAFEAWRGALELSGPGDAVLRRSFPRDKRAERRDARSTEGVEEAVLRRLATLAPPHRRAFRLRFEPLAEAALEGVPFTHPPSAQLERIERTHPLTVPAARAALASFEVALEAGRTEHARTWLERAERHARLGGFDDERWAAAFAQRHTAWRALANANVPAGEEAWRHARELELVETFAFAEVGPGVPRLRSGLRSGAVFLPDGRFVVQTGDAIVTIDPDDPLPLTLLASEIVIKLCGWSFERPHGLPGSDWACLPATDGEAVVVVAGHGDALLCIETPLPGEPARLRWALSEEGALGPGWRRGPGEILPDGAWDFQPGPLIADGRVFVQARRWAQGDGDRRRRSGKPRAVLIAVELATGRVEWSRMLALGSDVRSGESVRQSAATFGLPALPLARVDGRLFAGTQLGVGSLLDAADGRLAWSFKNRRRAPGARGWDAGRRPFLAAPCSDTPQDGAPALVWAPADSDFLYWMRTEPDSGSTRLLARPPEPIGGARELLGGSLCEAVVAGRAGARRALETWSPDTGERRTALLLRREEVFRRGGLASETRVLVSTDRGLYLLDRERDLYLLQQLPLVSLRPRRGSGLRASGGSVHAAGDRVLVVGRGDLWLFRAR